MSSSKNPIRSGEEKGVSDTQKKPTTPKSSFLVRYALAWSLAFCASFAVGAHLVYREMKVEVSRSIQSRWLESEEILQRSLYGSLENWPGEVNRQGERLRSEVLSTPNVIRQESGRAASEFADSGSDLLYVALWTRTPNGQSVRLNGAWNAAYLRTESPAQMDWAARTLDTTAAEGLKSAWEGRSSWVRVASQGVEKELKPLVKNPGVFKTAPNSEALDFSVIAVALPMSALEFLDGKQAPPGAVIPELKGQFPSSHSVKADRGQRSRVHDVVVGYFRVTRLDRITASLSEELGVWLVSEEGSVLSRSHSDWGLNTSLLKTVSEGEVFPLQRPSGNKDFRGVYWVPSGSRGPQLVRRLQTPSREVLLLAAYPSALLEPALMGLEQSLRNWALVLVVLGVLVGWSQARARKRLQVPREVMSVPTAPSVSSTPMVTAPPVSPSRQFRKVEGVFVTWRIQDSESWSKSLSAEVFARGAEEYRTLAQRVFEDASAAQVGLGFHLYQESLSSFEAMIWSLQGETCQNSQLDWVLGQLLSIRGQLSQLHEARKTDGEAPMLWEMAVHLGEAVLSETPSSQVAATASFWSTAEEGVHRLMRLCGESGTDLLVSQKWVDRVGAARLKLEELGEAWLDSESGVIKVFGLAGFQVSGGEGAWSELRNSHFNRPKVARSAPEIQFSARKLWWVNNGNQILGPMKDTDVAAALYAQEIDFDCECWAEGFGETAPIQDAGIFGSPSATGPHFWVFDGKQLYGPLTEAFTLSAWDRGAIPRDARICEGSTALGWLSFEKWIESRHAETRLENTEKAA